MQILYRLMAIFLLTLLATPALHAATISILPASNNVMQGESFSLEITGEGFNDGVTGGGFILDFDTAVVNIQNVRINEDVFDFGSKAGNWDNTAGTLTGSGFSTLWGIGDSSFLIATIDFEAVGTGSSVLDLERGIFNIVDMPGKAINDEVQFVDANVVSSSVSPIPLPAAAWLMLSGIGLMGAIGRRRRKASAT